MLDTKIYVDAVNKRYPSPSLAGAGTTFSSSVISAISFSSICRWSDKGEIYMNSLVIELRVIRAINCVLCLFISLVLDQGVTL